MNRKELKRKMNNGFDQLSKDIELKPINIESLKAPADNEMEDIFENEKRKTRIPPFNYRTVAVTLSLLLLITLAFAYMKGQEQYTKLTIRVNASATLFIKDSKVVKIKEKGRDGEKIIAGIKKDDTIEDAIDKIICNLDNDGHFNQDSGEIDIHINGREEKELRTKASNQLQKTLSSHHIPVSVIINEEIMVGNNKDSPLEESDSQDGDSDLKTTGKKKDYSSEETSQKNIKESSNGRERKDSTSDNKIKLEEKSQNQVIEDEDNDDVKNDVESDVDDDPGQDTKDNFNSIEDKSKKTEVKNEEEITVSEETVDENNPSESTSITESSTTEEEKSIKQETSKKTKRKKKKRSKRKEKKRKKKRKKKNRNKKSDTDTSISSIDEQDVVTGSNSEKDQISGQGVSNKTEDEGLEEKNIKIHEDMVEEESASIEKENKEEKLLFQERN